LASGATRDQANLSREYEMPTIILSRTAGGRNFGVALTRRATERLIIGVILICRVGMSAPTEQLGLVFIDECRCEERRCPAGWLAVEGVVS